MTRILYVAHSVPPFEYSGTPLIAARYAALARAAGFDVGVAFGLPRPMAPGVSADGIKLFPIPHAREKPWAFEAFSVPPRPDAATEPLMAFRPDIVHIIDWVDLPSALLGAVQALGVPVIRHVCNPEDFCSLKLPIWFHPDNATCRVLTAQQCGECLAGKVPERETERVTRELAARGEDASPAAVRRRTLGYFADLAQRKWQAMHSHFESIYDELIFPSESFRTYYASMVGLGDRPCRVVGHGIDPPAKTPPRSARDPGAPIRFTFLRWFPMKGGAAVEGCFQRLFAEGEGRVRLAIHGVSDNARSPLIGRPEVEVHGAYRPEDIDSVLADTDVGLVPSLFESFCLTCREMLVRGIPVIGSTAFGIPDAVRHGLNGLLVANPTADSLYTAVRSLLNSPELLARITEGARATTLRTPEDEFADILAVYRDHGIRW